MSSVLQLADFRGYRDEDDSAQYFSLSTTSGTHSQSSFKLPQLPSGNLISGLPAALMSRAQVTASLLLESAFTVLVNLARLLLGHAEFEGIRNSALNAYTGRSLS